MTVAAARGDAARFSCDLLALPWIEGEEAGEGAIAAADRLTGGDVRRAVRLKGLGGRARESALVFPRGGVRAPRVLVLGLGRKKDLTAEGLRRQLGSALPAIRVKGVRTAAIVVTPALLDALPAETIGASAAEALALADYRFTAYARTSPGAPAARGLLRVTLIAAGAQAAAALGRGARLGSVIASAANLARDLVNEPPSVLTPARLAAEAKALGRRGSGVRVKVLGKRELEKLGMGGILAVGSGGGVPPCLVVLRYGPRRGRPIVLVGKGVTFDSGGLQIKPAKSMENMKSDMAGAAAVLGVFEALPKLKPAIPVVGLVPSAENLVGEAAFKPRDVVRLHSGKTVEILHTDAEGRLLLADALSYARRENARATIDLATLTGACVVALGDAVAGLFSSDDKLRRAIEAASAEAGEDVWALPLHADYRDRLKGDVSDLKNVGGSGGGAITAALFLEEFAGDGPWAHLDIAGPAFLESARDYLGKGGSGFGVRTLLRYVLSQGGGGRRRRE